MEVVKKDSLKGKIVSDFSLYKEFIMEVIKKNGSKLSYCFMKVTNNFFGGIGERFKNRKFECLKTVKEDHHLLWLGKQTVTVAWDMGRCLYDVLALPLTMLMKAGMKLNVYEPTEPGPWSTARESSLMRKTGELLADVGAVVWDSLLLMKCSVVTTAKLVGHLGNGVETLLHAFSDRKITEATVPSGPSDLQKNSSDHQNTDHLAHDMSNAPKGTPVTSAPGKMIMGDSSSEIIVPLLRTVGR